MISRKSLTILLATLLGAAALVHANVPDQPYMEAARADLQKAKAELLVAEHNKGGHRAKAVGLVNQAIAEVNRGIQFARRNNHAEAAFDLFAVSPDQPHMRSALDNLKNARNNLVQATADKGGHRANAIKLIDQAIAEVNLGIAAGS
jgi:hypothetical protein